MFKKIGRISGQILPCAAIEIARNDPDSVCFARTSGSSGGCRLPAPTGAESVSLSEPTLSSRAGLPVVRGMGTLWFFYHFIRDPLNSARAAFDRYGPLVAFESFAGVPKSGRTTIFAVGADFNRAILSEPHIWHTGHLPTGGPPGTALFRLGENLVSLNGPRHDYYRKLLARPLRGANIEQLGDDIGELVARKVAAWPLGAVDLWPLAQDLMRTVAVALLFSGDQARGAALGKLIGQLARESKSAQVYLSRAGFPGGAYQRLLRRAEEVERCAINLAATKRGVKSERDLISLIVNSPDETGGKPSQEHIAGHIPVLFGSSYETCQTVLTWTIFLLAQHPHVARAVTDEISAALKGASPTLSRVASLPLLDAVVRESMRLLPPVPYQTRVAFQPTQLGGHAVAPRTYVLLSPFLTNRAPEIYDEPARFKPERWSRINPSAFEYLAFSGGPRACPGFSFGTSVVKVAVATILSRFRVSLVPGARIDYRVAITMAPRNGLAVTLHEPDGAWSSAPVKGQITRLVDMTPRTVH
jgi:cytochrome P450